MIFKVETDSVGVYSVFDEFKLSNTAWHTATGTNQKSTIVALLSKFNAQRNKQSYQTICFWLLLKKIFSKQ